jgi:hypothetical protein
MHRPVLIPRPQRVSSNGQSVARPIFERTKIKRSEIAVPLRRRLIDRGFSAPSPDFQPDPYLDYGRMLTDEGGILIFYKDFDVRLRHTLWRLFAWTTFTALGAFYLSPYTPLADHWIKLVALTAIAIANFLIVRKPVELYRRIEVRPDCLIVDGSDIFWRRHMEGGYPGFRLDDEGNQMLCGIYGTRFVEYLTVRHFDENDRTMDVFAAHLQDAMQQLWSHSPI